MRLEIGRPWRQYFANQRNWNQEPPQVASRPSTGRNDPERPFTETDPGLGLNLSGSAGVLAPGHAEELSTPVLAGQHADITEPRLFH